MPAKRVQETKNPTSSATEATDRPPSTDTPFMQLSRLDERTGNISRNLDNLSDRVDANHRDLSGKIDTTNARIDAANTRIDTTNTKIDDVHKDLSNKIDTTNARIDTTNTRIDNVHRDLSSRIDATNAKVDNLGKELSNKIDETRKELTTKIETSHKDLTDAIGKQGEKFSTTEKILLLVKGGAIVLGIVVPLTLSLLWWVLGTRITEVLGIGDHRTPVEHSSVEKTSPH